MTDHSFSIGDLVSTVYKTGEYIGELIDLSGARAVVKVLAVVKHPTQGDLHNPLEVDVPIFHQRRALAYQEKAAVPVSTLKAWNRPLPDYQESLHSVLDSEIQRLEKTKKWASRALDELNDLKKDYFPQ